MLLFTSTLQTKRGPYNPDYHQCGSRFLFAKPFVNGIISLTLGIPHSFRLTINPNKKKRVSFMHLHAFTCFACELTLT